MLNWIDAIGIIEAAFISQQSAISVVRNYVSRVKHSTIKICFYNSDARYDKSKEWHKMALHSSKYRSNNIRSTPKQSNHKSGQVGELCYTAASIYRLSLITIHVRCRKGPVIRTRCCACNNNLPYLHTINNGTHYSHHITKHSLKHQ